MPPVITAFILLFIVGIIGLTRLVLETDYRSEKGNTVYASSIPGDEFSSNEKEIVELLTDGVTVANNPHKKDMNTYFIFNSCLINYLLTSEAELGSERYEEIKAKINQLINIIKLEGQTDFRAMSIDGKAVAIDIAKEIYKTCGLKLSITMKGEIREISDQSGNVIYENQGLLLQTEVRVVALIITLSGIVVLFGIIIIVAKRNNSREEVVYDGFDKKRYA